MIERLANVIYYFGYVIALFSFFYGLLGFYDFVEIGTNLRGIYGASIFFILFGIPVWLLCFVIRYVLTGKKF